MPSDYSIVTYGNIAADIEADENYKTRQLLDSICASVENIVDAISFDVESEIVEDIESICITYTNRYSDGWLESSEQGHGYSY